MGRLKVCHIELSPQDAVEMTIDDFRVAPIRQWKIYFYIVLIYLLYLQNVL